MPRPKKIFGFDLDAFKRAAAQPIIAEIDRLEGHLADLRTVLAGLGVNGKATAKTAKKTRKAKGTSPTALAEKGNAAVAYLRKKPGEWVSGAELAEKIGTDKVAPAIKAADDGEMVEKKGPGRARLYKIKG